MVAPPRLARRAKIVFTAATRQKNQEIAAELGCARRTFGTWRNRFAETQVDVLGLYLDPPEHVLVLSRGQKSQIQALDGTRMSPPMFPGRLKTLMHDHTRGGTTILFAAIELAEDKIIA